MEVLTCLPENFKQSEMISYIVGCGESSGKYQEVFRKEKSRLTIHRDNQESSVVGSQIQKTQHRIICPGKDNEASSPHKLEYALVNRAGIVNTQLHSLAQTFILESDPLIRIPSHYVPPIRTQAIRSHKPSFETAHSHSSQTSQLQ